MSRKWTPRPWIYAPLKRKWGIYEIDGSTIATVDGAYGVAAERREADARLIAAAPYLYEALARLIQHLPPSSMIADDPEDFDLYQRALDRARHALLYQRALDRARHALMQADGQVDQPV